jgi:hypothetical protein
LVLIPLAGLAQEGLRNALNEDRAARVRQTGFGAQTDQLRAGPVNFTLGLSYEAELNDNVNISGGVKQSDLIQRPQMDFLGIWPVTGSSRLTFGAGIGYAKYLQQPERDRFFISPNSELALDIPARDFLFTFYDRFHYSQDVVSEGALSGVAEFPRYENTAGARADWKFRDWNFQADYGHFNFISAGAGFDQSGRSSEQFSARAGYMFEPEKQAGLEASGSLTDYDAPTQRDNYSLSVGPYVEWKAREAIQLRLRGGFTYYSFIPTNSFAPSESLSSYYVSAEVNHELTKFISHGLSAVHEIRAGINQGSDHIESSVVTYHASWKARPNTTLSADLFYEMGKEPQLGSMGPSTEEFDRFGAGVQLSHQLTRKFSAGLGYDFTLRKSNQPRRDYQQNRLTLHLRYQF